MRTANQKGKFYPETKNQAIKQWLDLALQDAEEGLSIDPEDILSNPFLAVDIANKAYNGKKPYGKSYGQIDVYAAVKSNGMACNGRDPHIVLGWYSMWTGGRWITWKISLDNQEISCIGYFDTGTNKPSSFIGKITEGEDIPLDKYDK